MKCFVIIIFLILPFYSNSQEIKIYHEKSKNGYRLYANNDEFAPVSVNIEFKFENLRLNGNHIVVLKPNERKQYIGDLQIMDKSKRYGFSYKTTCNLGDTFLEKYNNDYEYNLPFPKDSSFTVIQGYNGEYSHKNDKALDFRMPVGTPIVAAREGMVVKVIDNNDKGCPTSECQDFNNYIKILHLDGTFADYVHLKYKGAKVNKGDTVKRGQLIGYSGNTGWSSEPHLHFVVYLQRIYERKTLPKFFKTDETRDSLMLEKGNIYLNTLEPIQ